MGFGSQTCRFVYCITVRRIGKCIRYTTAFPHHENAIQRKLLSLFGVVVVAAVVFTCESSLKAGVKRRRSKI